MLILAGTYLQLDDRALTGLAEEHAINQITSGYSIDWDLFAQYTPGQQLTLNPRQFAWNLFILHNTLPLVKSNLHP